MKKSFTFRILLRAVLIISVFLIGCSDDDSSDENIPKAKVYDRGAPDGPAVQKTVGPDGGTIATGDGRISVTIPPGTVSTETVFSIQPITNTLPLSSGMAYRLLPEDVTFMKPVMITLKYNENDFKGSAPEAAFLAFQNHQGYWKLMRNTSLDKINKTLSVETTHFSDWGMIEEVRVEAEKSVLDLGETTKLKLTKINILDDDLLAPLTPGINVLPEDVTWRIISNAGALTVVENGSACNYTAPSMTPSPNPVEIETFIKNLPITSKANRTAQLFILTPITIVGGNYIKYTYKGSEHYLTDIAVILDTRSNLMTISAGLNSEVGLVVNGKAAGTYPYGDVENIAGKGRAVIFNDFENFHTTYPFDVCDEIPEDTYSPGGITITQWPSKVGDMVVGTFTATVARHETCPLDSRTVNGEFQVKRLF